MMNLSSGVSITLGGVDEVMIRAPLTATSVNHGIKLHSLHSTFIKAKQ